MENESKIKCLECGKPVGNIGMHLRTHKLTSKEYLARYLGASLTSSGYREKHRSNILARYESSDLREKVGKRTFDFIKNEDLKSILRRDYRYARISLENELWKPSIILYGSIIEAILVEATGAKTFDNALKLALVKKIISEKQYHKIYLVKDLRNFVHIHKELEEKEEINDYWAKTFGDICESIIKYFKK